ncbi:MULTISPECIES: Ger(x)C family spore germination protein [unclassified Paenibacillus]|uniref:Ger(x)C family spore germination protein n=1 Tax=unclassified Paenibacillus TaxID=185978 RepID=UPI002784763B|nr:MULTISPECIES: Ger(x)C family spore germination protein [unclassified Paenibacillus]MDQ0901955.1 spore germination protein KC [Paenibacillus sp. V4I7]MDQ0919550.1 spore germination protein KC [Paenibacillus sp. V4I5]
MKRWLRIGILLIPLVITGCWDRMEINDIGLVMGTGLDLMEDGNIRATLQISVPSPSSQTTGVKEGDRFFLISEVGKNAFDLDQKLQQKMSRTLFFSHRSVILIGESLARHGINDILDSFSRHPRNRLKTYVFVVKGMKAGDLLQVHYPYELVPAEALKEMQIMRGEGISTTLRDFLIASASEGINPAVGVLEPTHFFSSSQKVKDELFRMKGTAIFKSSALVGFLDNAETHAFLWFKKNKKTDKIVADLPEGNGNVGYFLTSSEVIIEPDMLGNHLKFHVDIKGKGNLFENNSRLDVGQPNNQKLIKKALENRVEHDMKVFLRKIQTQYKTDIVGFGQQFQRKDPQKWRIVEEQWDRHFAAAEISVSVNLTINNTGAIGPSLHLKEKEIMK